MASPHPPSNRLPLFFIVLQGSSKVYHLVIMSPRPFANYTGFPYPLAYILKSASRPPDIPSLYTNSSPSYVQCRLNHGPNGPLARAPEQQGPELQGPLSC